MYVGMNGPKRVAFLANLLYIFSEIIPVNCKLLLELEKGVIVNLEVGKPSGCGIPVLVPLSIRARTFDSMSAILSPPTIRGITLARQRYNVPDWSRYVTHPRQRTNKGNKTSNCNWGLSICTQTQSSSSVYSSRRFNRNGDVVLSKIFSEYHDP
jgi:hypothetical protein